MNAAKGMDSVFADSTEKELEFDAMFDDDDSIIDIIAGVDEAGIPLTGEDFDWEAFDAMCESDQVGDKPDFDYPNDEVGSDYEGADDDDLEIGGEIGDGKEVSGKENSAESHANDTKDEDKAIGVNDKQQTKLEAAEEGPLEDDDEAERAGKVPKTAVETESAAPDISSESGVSTSPEPSTEPVAEMSLADKVIAQIQETANNDDENVDDEKEADENVASGTDENCKESSLDNIIASKLAEKAAVREAKENEILNAVLDEMSEEDLKAKNVKDIIAEKVAAKKGVCPDCGNALADCTCKGKKKSDNEIKKAVKEMVYAMLDEADDPIQDADDAKERDGKVSHSTRDVEGVKQDVIGADIAGSNKSDPIEDSKCPNDSDLRAGKNTGVDDTEGVKQKVIGAALEASENIDDLLSDDSEIDIENIEDDLLPDKEVQKSGTANEIPKDVETQKEAVEDIIFRGWLVCEASDKAEAEEAADLVDDDEEIIDIIEDDSDDIDIKDLEYDYDDDELIDIAINGGEE